MDGEYQGPFQAPSYAPTPRSQTAGPTAPGYARPYEDPDRSNTLMEDGYYKPPPRSNTAGPSNVYHPPADPVYARSHTAGPSDSYHHPADPVYARSQTAGPSDSYHPPADPVYDRSQTAGPSPYAAKKYVPARLTEQRPPSDMTNQSSRGSDDQDTVVSQRQWDSKDIVPPSPRRFDEERRSSERSEAMGQDDREVLQQRVENSREHARRQQQ